MIMEAINKNHESEFKVISNPIINETIEQKVEKIFIESIKIIGGLKNLIQYRNLTWLPTLAEASYIIVLHNDYIKTAKEIAQELGITEQTVKKILKSNEEEVKKLLEGSINVTDEHIAGGIAKLAYKKIKSIEK